MKLNVRKYSKFVVAVAGFFALLGFSFSDGVLTDTEVAGLVSVGVAAAGVFGVRNKYLTEVQGKAADYADDGKLNDSA